MRLYLPVGSIDPSYFNGTLPPRLVPSNPVKTSRPGRVLAEKSGQNRCVDSVQSSLFFVRRDFGLIALFSQQSLAHLVHHFFKARWLILAVEDCRLPTI